MKNNILKVSSSQEKLIESIKESIININGKDVYVWCREAYNGVNSDGYYGRYTLVLDK